MHSNTHEVPSLKRERGGVSLSDKASTTYKIWYYCNWNGCGYFFCVNVGTSGYFCYLWVWVFLVHVGTFSTLVFGPHYVGTWSSQPVTGLQCEHISLIFLNNVDIYNIYRGLIHIWLQDYDVSIRGLASSTLGSILGTYTLSALLCERCSQTTFLHQHITLLQGLNVLVGTFLGTALKEKTWNKLVHFLGQVWRINLK